MTSVRSRLLCAALAALLALGAPVTALAQELPASAPGGEEADRSAELLAITVPDYTPGAGLQSGDVSEVQAGGLYTLIVLPSSQAAERGQPKALTADLLLACDPLFVGSAVAGENGKVTFTNIRLRSAQAAVYYVTGPGLTTPLAEATSRSVAASGSITCKVTDAVSLSVANATVSLVDKETGYAYANSVRTDADGNYRFDNLAPGEYQLHVEKPGCLPATQTTHVSIHDDAEKILAPFDIAACLGDVNNDGVRDMADLTALLEVFGKDPAQLPDGLTPDLSGDGRVDQLDQYLLLLTMNAVDQFPEGTGSTAQTPAKLAVRDTADPKNQTARTLTFSVDSTAKANLTFTAASVSLTFRTDYIQPINSLGGAVYPSNSNVSANCLIPKKGVSVSDVRWSVAGDLATLNFSLSCKEPTQITDLADFRYRPAPGKTTADFFDGVFSVDHLAAQVGQDSVITQESLILEYPNSEALELDEIVIDQKSETVIIPAAGRTVVRSLTATGKKAGANDRPNLPGVTWTLSGATTGVSIADGLLTVTSQAQPGILEITASQNALTSDPLIITLENSPSVPTRVEILKDGALCDAAQLTGPMNEVLAAQFTARVLDQYGVEMTTTAYTWSLTGTPAGTSLTENTQTTTLTIPDDLPAGTYRFSLGLTVGEGETALHAAIPITLERTAVLTSLSLSGPNVAQIPTQEATTLQYHLTALDALGHVMSAAELTPSFTVEKADGGETAGLEPSLDPMTGSLTLTVTPTAAAGDYILKIEEDALSAQLPLTLQAPQAETDPAGVPVSAGISYGGVPVSELSFTTAYGAGPRRFEVRHVLFDRSGNRLTPENETWSWSLSDNAPSGLTWETPTHTDTNRGDWNLVELSCRSTIPVGVYVFSVTARETVSGLEVTVPVTLNVISALERITLTVPESLAIPADGSVRMAVRAEALGSDGNSIPLPDDLVWSVRDANDESKTPAGVSIENGVLEVTSAAKPGTVEISVRRTAEDSDEFGSLDTFSTTLELTGSSSADDRVLALRRDGELLFGGVDAVCGKEGKTLTLAYTPVLLDRSTGEVTELKTDDVTWSGVQGSFTVTVNDEPGVRTLPVTAVYQSYSVSLMLEVTIYPDITYLYVDFDEGDADSTSNRYSFPVPVQTPKTYHGTVMAQIKRNGHDQYLPLAHLGLTDYDLEIYSFLTGVSTAYDKATGRLALTIEPLASSNSMADPGPNDPETRFLAIDFDYYPGQEKFSKRQTLLLTREKSRAVNAILRQGSGAGSKFVFETTRGETTLAATPGVFSDCYALELLDQYGDAITSEKVEWTLTGSPKNADGKNLVTLLDPGAAISAGYPRYQSIRRLRIDQETPEGTYSLTLTASAAGFSRSLEISLVVSGQQALDAVTLTGPDQVVIPMWYAQYNSSTLNNETKTLSYVAVVQDPNGHEVDASLCDFTWSVLTQDGKAPAGVTVRPNADNAATATVTVDRKARPTKVSSDGTKIDPIRVVVSATPKSGEAAKSAETQLALSRGSLVPTLMKINGPSQYKLELTDPDVTKTYTFTLLNQYNEDVSERDASSVTWTLTNKPSYVTMTKFTDKDGQPAVRLTVKNPKRDTKVTVTLTASIEFDEASTASGRARVYQSLSIPITVGNPSADGGGGGLGGGDLLPPEETPPVTASSVTPSTSRSGTTGTVSLSKDEIDILSNTTAAGTLTIAPTNTSGLTSVTVTIPASVATAIKKNGAGRSLRIQTAIGTLTLSANALSSWNKGSGNLSVTILNQDNKLAVTFRANGSEVKTFSSGTASFQAPVKGEIITAVSGAISSDVPQKSSVTNGSLTVSLNGSAELTLGNRGKTFSDTQNLGDWAKNAVEFVTSRKLFEGTSETTFDPTGEMTRGMVVTVLHRLEDKPASSGALLFRDVPNNTWYTDAVVWANAQGIVQGTGDGFLPNDPVTREQLATILYRYMGKIGQNTSKRASLSSFSDSGKVSAWARDALEWAVSAGIITGKGGGVLDPGGNASRVEVAAMLERLVRAITPSV